MTFAKLAEYFEKLEVTSSRLSLIEILSDLFKESSDGEIDKIVYLTQGRIAPFFEPLEIGMAEKNVAASIGLAYGKDKEHVLKLYKEKGDMGIAVAELSANSKLKTQNSKLEVEEVFNILMKIAKTGGAGSVEKKQTELSDLLKKLDTISAKHLVRIPLGNLRLGIGDPTILDALATAKLGDKSKRKLLEGAYNRTSDLGLIAKTLWSHSLSSVEKLEVTVGRPIRAELCERLPNPEKVIEKMGEVDVQYKYDGFRVQIHFDKSGKFSGMAAFSSGSSEPQTSLLAEESDNKEVKMFSRNLESMTHMFPELIEATKKQVKATSVILDCEALAYNPESEEFLPFQETTKRRRKHGIEEMQKKLPLKAFVFDILYKNGKSLIDEPLTRRMEILRETIEGNEVLIPTKNQKVNNPKVLATLLEDAISKGLEGLVVKRMESKYEAGGRNFNWVKLKRHSSGELHDTIDCVILGYVTGRGKRTEFGAGALLVGIYDEKQDEFVTVSRIGTGLSDDEWREIHKRADKIKVDRKPARVNSLIEPSVWIKPEIVIEVLADEITRSPLHTAGKGLDPDDTGYALRFPRLVNFRNDRTAEEATTVKELIEMYQQQGKK